jgi:serine/threonine-protein kinase
VLAEIHKSLHWDWMGAESEYRKAVALSPNCEAAHRAYAVFLASMSHDREATIEAARACDLDPLCLVVNTSAAWVDYVTGDYDAAIERCRHTIEMESGYLPARRLLGAAYLQAGRAEDAIGELEEAARIGGSDPVTLAWVANAMAVSGRRKEAIEGAKALREMSGYRYVPSYHTALVHVGLADLDTASALLNQACEERDTALLSVRVEPRFAPLRADPRYEALLERLGLIHARRT